MKRLLQSDMKQYRDSFPVTKFSVKQVFRQKRLLNASTLNNKVKIPEGYISLEAFMEHVHKEIEHYHAEKDDCNK